MERQILQVLHSFNHLPHKVGEVELPQQPLSTLVDFGIEDKDQGEQYMDLMRELYNVIEKVHKVGIADRIIWLFDEYIKLRIGMADVFTKENIERTRVYAILDEDMTSARELSEKVAEYEKTEIKVLEEKIHLHTLKSLNNKDLKDYKTYLDLEDKLKDIISVKYQGGGIKERTAEVVIYGSKKTLTNKYLKPTRNARRKAEIKLKSNPV